jgi:hypothetical protein
MAFTSKTLNAPALRAIPYLIRLALFQSDGRFSCSADRGVIHFIETSFSWTIVVEQPLVFADVEVARMIRETRALGKPSVWTKKCISTTYPERGNLCLEAYYLSEAESQTCDKRIHLRESLASTLDIASPKTTPRCFRGETSIVPHGEQTTHQHDDDLTSSKMSFKRNKPCNPGTAVADVDSATESSQSCPALLIIRSNQSRLT